MDSSFKTGLTEFEELLSLCPISVQRNIISSPVLDYKLLESREIHIVEVYFSHSATSGKSDLKINGYTILFKRQHYESFTVKKNVYPPASGIIFNLDNSDLPIDVINTYFNILSENLIFIGYLFMPTNYRQLLLTDAETGNVQHEDNDSPSESESFYNKLFDLPLLMKLKTAGLFNLLEDAYELLNKELVRQENSQVAKKNILEEKVISNNIQTSLHSRTTNSRLKETLNSEATYLSKSVDRLLEELLVSERSESWFQLNSPIEKMEELAEEKRPSKTKLTVPVSITNKMLSVFTSSLTVASEHQLQMIRHGLTSTVTNINTLLEEQAILSLSQQRPLRLGSDDFGKLIHEAHLFPQPYEGEDKRKGFMQYVYSARQYQIALLMIASTFGGSALLNNKNSFFLPASFFLVGLGIFQIVRKTNLEKEEAREKELSRAKLQLTNGLRQARQEVYRSWKKLVMDELNEQFKKIEEEVQKNLSYKEESLRKQRDLEHGELQLAGRKISDEDRLLSGAITKVKSFRHKLDQYRNNANKK